MAEALTQHQILVEQVDSDVHVQIPEYLGGGSITESDYTVSENQAKLIMSVLGWATEDELIGLLKKHEPKTTKNKP